MGIRRGFYAGKARLDIGVTFIQKLCSSYTLFPLRKPSNPLSLLSLASASIRLKHPDLFGYSDMFDITWHKGLHDSNLLITHRYPRPPYLGHQSLTIKHSVSPEVAIHGHPKSSFSHSASRGVRLSKLSIGIDTNEPSKSNWCNTIGFYFKHIHFRNDGGRSISTDQEGYPLTRSGEPFDNMVVLSQESRFEDANDNGFIHLNLLMEQGIPFRPNLLAFSRFSFFASKGVKLGPAFLSSRLTGGSVVGSVGPHLAFPIGGHNSVRGYGEGAVGCGQSCLVSNSELAFPLNKKLTGVVFLDYGSDLETGNWVLGNPAQRQHKPGTGFGIGYGIRFKNQSAEIKVDYAINAFQQSTVYFGISNLVS